MNGHSAAAIKTKAATKPPKRHRLPPFLRFRFPLNILFYLVLPLLMPLALSLVLYRFGRESRRSRKRLRGSDSEGLWARIREVEQALEGELEDGFARADDDRSGAAGSKPVKTVEGKPVSELRLTESQRAMIRSLDQLPNLEKVCKPLPHIPALRFDADNCRRQLSTLRGSPKYSTRMPPLSAATR